MEKMNISSLTFQRMTSLSKKSVIYTTEGGASKHLSAISNMQLACCSFITEKKQLVLQEIYAKLILYNFSEAITNGIVINKKDRKYAYSVNFALALSICVELLRRNKQGHELTGLEKLLERELIPIRPGRSSPRFLRARTAVSFLYR